MPFTTPAYSRSRIRRAGRELIAANVDDATRRKAVEITDNWRLSHGYPLNTIVMNLRNRAQKVAAQPLIAQRLKRRASIEAKLRKMGSGMTLLRMQDLGGCRAIVRTIGQVRELEALHLKARGNQQLIDHRDYIANPRATGYRSIHFVYKHCSPTYPEYDGLRIEVQLRSDLQHAWATAVETVDFFTRQNLKGGEGVGADGDDWLRFFALMSSAIAMRESSPFVSSTPSTKKVLRAELKWMAQRLGIIERFSGFQLAAQELDVAGTERLFLMEINVPEGELRVRRYRNRRREEAAADYAARERATAAQPGVDVVLVSVDSFAALKKAYPNYFADTGRFLELFHEASK
jgi:hypothetical protein